MDSNSVWFTIFIVGTILVWLLIIFQAKTYPGMVDDSHVEAEIREEE